MAVLVGLDQAIRHLRLGDDTSEYDDLQLKLDQAEAMVVHHISQRIDTVDETTANADWLAEIAAWDVSTVPGWVQVAILYQLTALLRFRGDDQADVAKWEHGLAPGVVGMLERFRDPAIA